MPDLTPEEGYAEAERRIEVARSKGSTSLSLHGLRLIQIPESVGSLVKLVHLDAEKNALTGLPDSVRFLTELQHLDLENNCFEAFPTSICNLPALTNVNFARNRLLALPETIGNLKKLYFLDLTSNALSGLPAAIGQLKELQRLHLSGNRLTALPDEINGLQNLRWLLLEDNQLRQLPPSFRELHDLFYLGLHNNPRLGLPPEILGLRLDPEGTIPHYDTPSAQPDALRNYYFEAHADGRRLNEVKLILVGRGEVGKTSLVRRLVSNTFDPKEEQTPGIKITHWKHDLPDYGEVQLNVWDFGGQEIMHGTHQFFLTERSLYLVVLTGRAGKEQEEAEYWLRFVQQFGNGAPTIVVLNKHRQLPFDLNRKALRDKYPFVAGFVETDCHGGTDAKAPHASDGFGIAALRDAIDAQLSHWEALRYRFPAKWFAVKDALSNMPEDYISFDEYRTICNTHLEPDARRQEHLAKYLNQLGIALNFKDDPRLRDTHVLKPNWLTNGVYTLLNHKPLAENQGVFRFSDLAAILPADKYPPEMHPFLLDLMRKFDLCFRLEEADERPLDAPDYVAADAFLLPERLPVNEPELGDRFDPEDCLGFEYVYATWPEGLVPRFIVRTYVLSEGKERWRSGVVIEFEGCEAFVRGDETDRTVTIRIAGSADGRRNALAVARAYFEDIHRAMGVEPKEYVLHPSKSGLRVSYQDLMVYEASKVPTFPVVWDGRVVNITVAELLNTADPPGTRLPPHALEKATRVFVSYAHRDEHHMERLKAHLKLAERQKLISVWYDRLLRPGDEWDPRILNELERAKIIVMLVSAHFFASDYIFEKELPRALERHKETGARAIAVVLDHCEWDHTDVAQFELLPPKGKPVVEWRPRAKAWTAVSQAVRAAAEEFQKKMKV